MEEEKSKMRSEEEGKSEDEEEGKVRRRSEEHDAVNPKIL